MAIDLGTETTEVRKQDYTWRIEMFQETTNVQLRFHRWLVSTNATTGEQVGEPDMAAIPTVMRTAAQVAGKTYTTSGGFSATGNQILNLMNAMSDAERQYDIDNPPAVPGP